MKFLIQGMFLSQIKTARSALVHAALGLMLLCASTSQAAFFHVDVNTASLIGSSSAPFSLDFQFNDGGVLGNNTATVSNFSYGGGGATGVPTLFDGAAGSIGSSITFDNSGTFQELFQTFTPGTTLGFDVFLTTSLDGATPDAFVFAILDSALHNIPTTGLGDSLLLVNIDSATPTAQTFAGTGNFAGVTVSAIPEPETHAMLLLGLGLMGLAAQRRKQKSA